MGRIVGENKHKGILYPADSKAIYRIIYEVVSVLPTENIKTSVIYCVPIIGKVNEYDMYLYIDGWSKIGSGSSSGITIINTETVPESAEWGDSIPANYAGNTGKAGELAYWEESGYFWGLCSLATDPITGNINYNWVQQADEIDIDNLKSDIATKMDLAPLNPTAAQIAAMPNGQLYGDTTNHKGVIKGGQEFYDSVYIDENYRKIIINNTRRPPYRVADGSYVKPGDIWIYYNTVCILYSINHDLQQGGYICDWIPIHNKTSILTALPSASGTLEIANYAEPSVSGRERAYPKYLMGDKISVGNTVYRVSLRLESSGNRYTYTFTRIPSADDTYTKVEISSMIGNIEAALSEV